MKVQGSVNFTAEREKVWDLFNNKDALQAATPGCERLDEVEDGVYEADLRIGLAAIRGSYTGKVAITDKQPPESFRMQVEGSGGPGFVQIDGEMRFEEKEEEGATTVHYDMDVKVGGAIAGVGQRVLGGVSRWLIGDFFKTMKRELDKQG